jgi:hypothetical protein
MSEYLMGVSWMYLAQDRVLVRDIMIVEISACVLKNAFVFIVCNYGLLWKVFVSGTRFIGH